jgi:hypothetical protein
MFIFWALVAFLSLFLISSAALSKGKDKERYILKQQRVIPLRVLSIK